MLCGRHPCRQPQGEGCFESGTSYIQVEGRQDRTPGYVSWSHIICHGGQWRPGLVHDIRQVC